MTRRDELGGDGVPDSAISAGDEYGARGHVGAITFLDAVVCAGCVLPANSHKLRPRLKGTYGRRAVGRNQ